LNLLDSGYSEVCRAVGPTKFLIPAGPVISDREGKAG